MSTSELNSSSTPPSNFSGNSYLPTDDSIQQTPTPDGITTAVQQQNQLFVQDMMHPSLTQQHQHAQDVHYMNHQYSMAFRNPNTAVTQDGVITGCNIESAAHEAAIDDGILRPPVKNETYDPVLLPTKPEPYAGPMMENPPSAYMPNAKRKQNGLRRGKWTPEEESYANRLIQEFKAGLLPLTDGTTLRTFLSKLLNCDPMRISKKFVGGNCIGKQVFRRRQVDLERLSPEDIERSRRELAELETKFLERVAQSNRKPSPRPADPFSSFHHAPSPYGVMATPPWVITQQSGSMHPPLAPYHNQGHPPAPAPAPAPAPPPATSPRNSVHQGSNLYERAAAAGLSSPSRSHHVQHQPHHLSHQPPVHPQRHSSHVQSSQDQQHPQHSQHSQHSQHPQHSQHQQQQQHQQHPANQQPQNRQHHQHSQHQGLQSAEAMAAGASSAFYQNVGDQGGGNSPTDGTARHSVSGGGGSQEGPREQGQEGRPSRQGLSESHSHSQSQSHSHSQSQTQQQGHLPRTPSLDALAQFEEFQGTIQNPGLFSKFPSTTDLQTAPQSQAHRESKPGASLVSVSNWMQMSSYSENLAQLNSPNSSEPDKFNGKLISSSSAEELTRILKKVPSLNNLKEYSSIKRIESIPVFSSWKGNVGMGDRNNSVDDFFSLVAAGDIPAPNNEVLGMPLIEQVVDNKHAHMSSSSETYNNQMKQEMGPPNKKVKVEQLKI